MEPSVTTGFLCALTASYFQPRSLKLSQTRSFKHETHEREFDRATDSTFPLTFCCTQAPTSRLRSRLPQMRPREAMKDSARSVLGTMSGEVFMSSTAQADTERVVVPTGTSREVSTDHERGGRPRTSGSTQHSRCGVLPRNCDGGTPDGEHLRNNLADQCSEEKIDTASNGDSFAGTNRRVTKELSNLAREGRWREALNLLRLSVKAAAREEEDGVLGPHGPVRSRSRLVWYNATLGALSKGGRWREALSLLREMEAEGIERDTIGYSAAIAACGRGRQWQKAVGLLRLMRANAVEVNSIVYCNTISACARCAQWETAVRLLREMEAVDGLDPTHHCYNAAIDACAKAGRSKEALSLLRRMQKLGLSLQDSSFLGAISACGRQGHWKQALSLLDEMKAEKIRPTVKCFSAAIMACGNGKQWHLAVRLLEDMSMSEVAPNNVCYNATITACGRGAQWQLALLLLKRMESGAARVRPDIISYNAAIDACAKCGRWQESKEILDGMTQRARELEISGTKDGQRSWPRPDPTTYGTAITACSNGKNWKLALELLKDMIDEGVKPTDAVFHAAIAACARYGRWRECLSTLDLMRTQGFHPTTAAYNSVVTGCARAGEWQRALSVLKQMCHHGVDPDVVTYNAALAACSEARQWQVARRLLESMRAEEPLPSRKPDASHPPDFDGGDEEAGSWEDGRGPQGRTSSCPPPPRPDSISFHTVLRALANARQWDDALEVLEELKQERLHVLDLEKRGARDSLPAGSLWPMEVNRFRAIFALGLAGAPVEAEGRQLRARALEDLAEMEREDLEAAATPESTMFQHSPEASEPSSVPQVEHVGRHVMKDGAVAAVQARLTRRVKAKRRAKACVK